MATRQFDLADQQAFAALSGDFNPIHVDSVAARRTLFGEPVVHGLHLVLWALDQLAKDRGTLKTPAAIRAGFKAPVLLGRDTSLAWSRNSAGRETAEIFTSDTLAAEITLEPADQPCALPAPGPGPELPVPDPAPLDADAMPDAAGHERLVVDPTRLAPLFPALAATGFDPGTLAVLLASTRIVGMHCPGLHSLYSELDLTFSAAAGSDAALSWQCDFFHPELRLAEIRLEGAGTEGTLTAFLRPSASRQLSMPEVAARLAASGRGAAPFAGHHALIIGGSRGVGEVAAKLMAAGGARVTLTYASGRADGEAVAAEIRAHGTEATAVPLDVTAAAPTLPTGITDLLYFAAPKIRQGARAGLDEALFETYSAFFVTAFARLVAALPELERVFYPSTVFVAEPESRFAEYAAAKAAGESLCAYLAAARPGLEITTPRLPRLATDQTAAIVGPEAGDPLAALMAHL
ncbi:MAG: SDR family NAD(P)-dependent oxidoreductase [Pseudomonadota bacterium]